MIDEVLVVMSTSAELSATGHAYKGQTTCHAASLSTFPDLHTLLPPTMAFFAILRWVRLARTTDLADDVPSSLASLASALTLNTPSNWNGERTFCALLLPRGSRMSQLRPAIF